MIKFIHYDGESTYYFPNGEKATPEILRARFPVILTESYVIQVEDNTFLGFDRISNLRRIYGIDPSLSEEDALSQIADIVNNPPQPEEVISAEERIAAALELQNLLAMEDTEI